MASSVKETACVEDLSPGLAEQLLAMLHEDKASPERSGIQDFEVYYCLRADELDGESSIQMQVGYRYLAEVWQNGSQAILERTWSCLPLRYGTTVDEETGCSVLDIRVSKAPIREKTLDLHAMVRLLASVRIFLLIGPLVERLRWLRGASHTHPAILKKAAAEPPALLALRVRDSETNWIVCKRDCVSIIITVHVDGEVDVAEDIALGRAFCQEFAETIRHVGHFTPPCSFESKDIPSDLRNISIDTNPNVGYLTFTFSDQSVRDVSEERLHQMAIPVMTFRNFFLYQLRCAGTALHSRVRKVLDGWQRKLQSARRAPRRTDARRRVVSGKEFTPSK
jgi:hypothetical protein